MWLQTVKITFPKESSSGFVLCFSVWTFYSQEYSPKEVLCLVCVCVCVCGGGGGGVNLHATYYFTQVSAFTVSAVIRVRKNILVERH